MVPSVVIVPDRVQPIGRDGPLCRSYIRSAMTAGGRVSSVNSITACCVNRCIGSFSFRDAQWPAQSLRGGILTGRLAAPERSHTIALASGGAAATDQIGCA